MFLDVLRLERMNRAETLFHEQLGIHDMEGIFTVACDTNHAEVLVAHHNGIGRTPLHLRESAQIDVIYVDLFGVFKRILPVCDCGKNGG